MQSIVRGHIELQSHCPASGRDVSRVADVEALQLHRAPPHPPLARLTNRHLLDRELPCTTL